MYEPQMPYYGLHINVSDPHFCPVCKLRNDDNRSFLSSQNYARWTNFGMCERCMRYFLGFDNGLMVTPQRTQKLRQVLKRDKKLKFSINPHLMLYMFPGQLQRYKKQRQAKNAGVGFVDQGSHRVCKKCDYGFILNQQTAQIEKCPKCDNPFDVPKFDWKI